MTKADLEDAKQKVSEAKRALDLAHEQLDAAQKAKSAAFRTAIVDFFNEWGFYLEPDGYGNFSIEELNGRTYKAEDLPL